MEKNAPWHPLVRPRGQLWAQWEQNRNLGMWATQGGKDLLKEPAYRQQLVEELEKQMNNKRLPRSMASKATLGGQTTRRATSLGFRKFEGDFFGGTRAQQGLAKQDICCSYRNNKPYREETGPCMRIKRNAKKAEPSCFTKGFSRSPNLACVKVYAKLDADLDAKCPLRPCQHCGSNCCRGNCGAEQKEDERRDVIGWVNGTRYNGFPVMWDRDAVEPPPLMYFDSKVNSECRRFRGSMGLHLDTHALASPCEVPKMGVPKDAHMVRIVPCGGEVENRAVVCALVKLVEVTTKDGGKQIMTWSEIQQAKSNPGLIKKTYQSVPNPDGGWTAAKANTCAQKAGGCPWGYKSNKLKPGRRSNGNGRSQRSAKPRTSKRLELGDDAQVGYGRLGRSSQTVLKQAQRDVRLFGYPGGNKWYTGWHFKKLVYVGTKEDAKKCAEADGRPFMWGRNEYDPCSIDDTGLEGRRVVLNLGQCGQIRGSKCHRNCCFRDKTKRKTQSRKCNPVTESTSVRLGESSTFLGSREAFAEQPAVREFNGMNYKLFYDFQQNFMKHCVADKSDPMVREALFKLRSRAIKTALNLPTKPLRTAAPKSASAMTDRAWAAAAAMKAEVKKGAGGW